jgi:transcription antitermination factor NusG
MNSSLTLSGWGRRLGRTMMRLPDRKPVFDTHRWNIVRGDEVHVIQGPQSGQQGKVLKIMRKSNRVIIDGVNMVSQLLYMS